MKEPLQNQAPKLRFPEFKGKWNRKKLEYFFSFKNGINASKENYGSGYKFINVLDIIENNYITYDRVLGRVDVSEEIFNKNIVEYGDVLFQRSSETREEVGQSNVYLDKERTATFGGFVIRGKMIKEYHPSFMNYLLKTSNSRKEITTKSGGSTRYNVGQETLKKVEIFTTSLQEQQKIATFLTAVDKKINQLQSKKALLQDYKKGVMQQIFSQELRFKDDEGNDNPDWEEKVLGEVATKTSSNISANTIEENIGQYKLYGASGYLKSIDFYKEEEEFISIVKDGAGVGRTLLCDAFSSVLGTLDTIKPKKNNSLYFIYALINNIPFAKYITGSTIPHIYFKDYSKEKIKIPCKEEQTKIANFLSAIDKKIGLVSTQLENTQLFKKCLLQQLFV